MSQVIPILLYHTVDTRFDERYRRWAVSPETFARHMDIIARHGCQAMTVSALVRCLDGAAPLPERPVVITFDDGLRDFLTGALPILRDHGFPATLYVVSGRIGETSTWLAPLGEDRRPLLSWDEVREVAQAGIEIGAHTHTHPQLDILSAARARDEIFRSRDTIERELGHKVTSFAYPHGYSSVTVRRLVREAGFTSACQVRHALSAAGENRLMLSRIIMTSEESDAQLEGFLSGAGLPVAPPRHHLKVMGWRMYRRLKQISGHAP
jgi:peptidoglycan/xylan/chitin deacetylase (PgdA/CDA1 family)